MKNCFRLCLLTAVLLAMGLLAAGAGAQVCLYMDFDDDADPWTIVTQTGDQPAWVWFVLEVPPNPPVNRNFEIWFQEGCCDHNWIGYYGMHIDYWTLEFDPAFVDSYSFDCATCTYCCPCYISAHFHPVAPMNPGERDQRR